MSEKFAGNYGAEGRMEMGVFEYKGYKVTVVEAEETDLSPAWFIKDLLTGEDIIIVREGLPERFLVPVLEHEIYELRNKGDHDNATEVGRRKAEELGILDDFLEFERHWKDWHKNNKELRG